MLTHLKQLGFHSYQKIVRDLHRYFEQFIFGQINFGHFFVSFEQISDKIFGHFLLQNQVNLLQTCSDASYVYKRFLV